VWEGFRLLQETTWQGKRTYLYDAEQPYTPVAAVTGRGESRKIWYYHTDVTGTVQEVSAADGTLVWAGYQAGFGENRGDISNSGAYFEQPLRLPGQYFDEETGLHYNLFRYYAPECGRFISQDPIGLAGGLNQYAYAPNPLKYIDPLGLTPCAVSNQKANRLLDSGETKVTVRSRSDAEQLFMDRYLGHNYKNMTGESGPSTKNLMEYLTGNKTKAGSYHWDDIKDPSVTKPPYRVSGHGPGNPDGDLPHLQVHQHDGSVIHIFFPWET
ncbi:MULTISPECIES: RHS repeat-associated core domain-containing protein, partial [unclassified Escherichia]|uniref:RHS repeat-associated core domain-containing protein n=1 Tax=unclassified Escherichia TaxID=2608889 RepID=UPI001EF1363D